MDDNWLATQLRPYGVQEEMKSSAIIEKLNNIPETESGLVGPIYEALEDVKEIDDPENFFPLAFKYMRERESGDFGTPGRLSHLIEEYFPKYVDDLAESPKIMPTEPTLFLARRIFNAPAKANKESIHALTTLVKALQYAKTRLDLEPWVITEIDEILP